MLQVSDSTFDKDILKAEKAVVDFWAEWCGPCRMLAPRFEELSKEMHGITFAKMNVEENQEVPGRYEIMSIPTLLIFKKGAIVGKVVGALPKESLKEKIEQALR